MTKIVGILNITPDSFSGDGLNAEAALARVDAMIAAGADVIDVGAESTRPGSTLLSPEEEWQRLARLIEKLGERVRHVTFSLDTRHAETAKLAVAHGFRIINDVSGTENNAMITFLQQADCQLVLMHSLSIPADARQTLPLDADAVEAVLAWANEKITRLEQQGIARSRLILDPGIGFGKTPLQSLALIKHIKRFKALETQLMVGHSRKSFLSLFTDKKAAERDPETLAVSYYLAGQCVDYLRVHDVTSHVAMLKIRRAL